MSTCEYELIDRENVGVYITLKLVAFALSTMEQSTLLAPLVRKKGSSEYSGHTGWPFFAKADRLKGRHFVVTHAKKDPSVCNGLLFFSRKMG
jgi:hypothetical protein